MVLTVLLVIAPMPLLLPALNDRAILSWHVLVHTDSRASGYSHLAMLLLGSYVLLLIVRYIAFFVGSALSLRHQASGVTALAAGAADDSGAHRRPWPLVTIVVPAYNEGLVIQQSIRSLLCMDYPCFEVLVVDDGSTDDTYQRALEASRGFGRVRVIRKPNGGKASALNVGLAHARGSLILNMDCRQQAQQQRAARLRAPLPGPVGRGRRRQHQGRQPREHGHATASRSSTSTGWGSSGVRRMRSRRSA